MQKPPITKSEPDEHGHWGKFGGRYVPETLVAPLDELTNEFTRAREDPNFWSELNQLLRDYCGRPTPLFHARRLTAHAGGAQIYLEAGRSFAHRRAQDQQRYGTGVACASNGQAPRHR